MIRKPQKRRINVSKKMVTKVEENKADDEVAEEKKNEWL